MKIAYIGRVTVGDLNREYGFDPPIPHVTCSFGIGTRLVEAFVAHGHEVSVITFNLPPYELVHCNSKSLDVYVVPERPRKKEFPTFYNREIAYVHEALGRIKPDVVLANWTYEFAKAALTSGYPTVVVAHDSPWRIFGSSLDFSTLFKAVYSQLAVFPKVKHLVAVSPHIERDMRKINGYRGDLAVIPNPMEAVPENASEKVIRREARTIAMSSQWMRLKNPKAMLHAFSSLRERHPDWRLVCYGCGFGKGEDAEKWMHRKGLPLEGVELRGWCPPSEIGEFLFDEADLFCSPSLEESFGMVFAEAMARGVPCVGGYKSGAVPWVIGCPEEGQDEPRHKCDTREGAGEEPIEENIGGGVVCDVANWKRLAECIEMVMEDLELRERLSKCGIRRVAEMFALDKVAKRYELELQRVANGKKS